MASAAQATTRNELKAFRLERGLTYRQLAALIGVKLSTTFQAVNGKRISELNQYKIEKFLTAIRNGGEAK